MEQIKGIFAASLSLLDKNLALDVKNTIKHAESIIDNGCHGVVFFGSTGQSQLISLSEKIQLINELPNSSYKENFIIGEDAKFLSGGQKQRLTIACALISNSNFIILDEPTALLDPVSQKSVVQIVRKLCKASERPLTALWITHRLEELRYCDGAARMKNGKVGPWLSGDLLMQGLRALAGRRV